jgi:hypothetical protein
MRRFLCALAVVIVVTEITIALGLGLGLYGQTRSEFTERYSIEN